MTSNGLSHRRTYLKRPIVCKASPPTPLPSTFQCNCTIEMSEDEEIQPGEEAEFTMDACSSEYEVGLPLRPSLQATAGEWQGTESLQNCDSHANVDWEAPDEPGFVTLSFEVVFPQGETCGASIIVEVPEED